MISLIIALHNEASRFPANLFHFKSAIQSIDSDWEIILVDDGSTDDTWKMVRRLASEDRHIRCVSNGVNLGQGAAIKMGALLSRGDVVMYSDADLSVPVSYFQILVDRIREGNDVAVGSRWQPEAKIAIPQPRLRKTLGRIYYALIHRLLLAGIHDTNCGLKAYRGDAARLVFGFVRSWRWAFNVEHLWLARRAGYRIVEVPVEWSHKEGSKVRVFRDCLFTLWEIFAINVRRFFRLYPRWETL
jgi:dolichyl-phosphate beta-glucosyltransferase